MRIKVWLRVKGTSIKIEDEIDIPDVIERDDDEEPSLGYLVVGEYVRAWVEEMIMFGVEVRKS